MAVVATRPIYANVGGGTGSNAVISDLTASKELIRGFTFQLHEKDGAQVPGFDLTLVLSPESLQKMQRSKNAITETQLGRWVDSIGLAGPRWQISGTFGYKLKARPAAGALGATEEIDGYQAHMEFESFVREYFRINRDRTLGSEGYEPLEMWFLDWEDDDFWVVEPEMIPEKRRDSGSPMLRNYNLSFIGIKDLLRDGGRTRDLLVNQINDRETRMRALQESLQVERDALIGLLSDEARQGWGEVINSKIRLVTAWITGATDAITAFEDETIGEAKRIVENIDEAIEALAASARAVDPNFLFADCIDTFRQIKCGIGVLLSFPEQFTDRFKDNVNNFAALFTESGCSSTLPSEKPDLF